MAIYYVDNSQILESKTPIEFEDFVSPRLTAV